MIKSLQISNYALIDGLEIEFSPGFNIITGETGAGKSIMLGALGLLLGARAESRAIRRSDAKSVVEAVFGVEGNTSLAAWAEQNELDWDDRECILRREMAPGGRARAFINDTPVPLGTLADLGRQLIDIHSQHENSLLAAPAFQLRIIDAMAANASLLADYKAKYETWRAAEKQLRDTQAAIEASRADEEFLRFRLERLQQARLVIGEQEELEVERDLQANMADIKTDLTNALNALSEGESNALESLSEASNALTSLGEIIEDMAPLAERLDSAIIEIQDILHTLGDYDSELFADPRALEQMEERLSLIYSLQKQHKVDSVEDLLQIQHDMEQRLAALDDSDFALSELTKAATKARTAAEAAAKKLTASRQNAAKSFEAELLAAAKPLGMPNLRCEVNIEPAALSISGADALEFRFAFNKSQEPIAVKGAASGGEISRLMLCVKSIVAGKLGLPTIIFDEVDTGVSGDIASRMGQMMAQMAESMQVITITHLPQVAALGSAHFKVYKEDTAEATHTRIRQLDETERRAELALMLSGSETDTAALATAENLLNRRKNGKI